MTRNMYPGRSAATLVRQYDARVLDISGAGCLIEMDATLAPGTIGTLEVFIDGTTYREAVRVARVVPARHIGMLHQIAIEFLVVTAPGIESIRAAMTRLTAGADLTLTFAH